MPNHFPVTSHNLSGTVTSSENSYLSRRKRAAARELTTDRARDSLDAVEIAKSTASAAVHSPSTAFPHCEILLSPLNYSRYPCIATSTGYEDSGERDSKVKSTHDESLKMQKGTHRRNDRLFRGGHVRQDLALTHGMAKLLRVINIYARHAPTARERERERKREGKEGTSYAFDVVRYCCMLHSLPQLQAIRSTFSATRFFGSGLFYLHRT